MVKNLEFPKKSLNFLISFYLDRKLQLLETFIYLRYKQIFSPRLAHLRRSSGYVNLTLKIKVKK